MTAMNITLHPRPLDASVDHSIQAIVTGTGPGETCTTDLAAGPWDFDARPGYGPGSSMGDVIPTGAPRQGELPAVGVDREPATELDGTVGNEVLGLTLAAEAELL